MKNILKILAFFIFISFPSVGNATAKFLVLCTTACTWDNSNDAIWSLSSGGINNTTHPTSADTATLDASTCVGGVTCTITVAATLSVTSITMGACTASTSGCILDFSVNNNNATITGTFSATGTGTRDIKLGSGTFTLTGVNVNNWDLTTTTNCTCASLASATFSLSSPSGSQGQAFSGGGKTYGTLSIGSRTNNSTVSLSGANTFATMNITAPVSVNFPAGTTTVITNAVNWSGSSSAQYLLSNTASSINSTVSIASSSIMTWGAFHGITTAGTGSAITATNSFDLQGNTVMTITPPATGGGGGRIIGG